MVYFYAIKFEDPQQHKSDIYWKYNGKKYKFTMIAIFVFKIK